MSAPAGAALVVADVGRTFGRSQALVGVSLHARGGVLALLGPNGAGKSTLLRCLATVLAPTSGRLLVDGLAVADPDARCVIRGRLGYMPQEPHFAPAATVWDVVDYLAVCKGHTSRRRRSAEVHRVLAETDLVEVAHDRVRTLSVGTRRRIGLAQALLGAPTLLLLDEPAAGLDPHQRVRLRGQLSALGERATVVISTHLTDEAAAFAQQLIVIDGGRVRFAGAPDELAATAAGRVWLADQSPAAGAQLSWRTPHGRHRAIGDPPPGAELTEPTLEDAYLLLVGASGMAGDP